MIAMVGTPWSGHQAIELSEGVWKKKLLPVGSVDYKGRTLNFDRDYLDGLASAFNGGAYSQVPFQLANSDNRHTNDPERYRGEVISMDADDTGLYITVQTTPAGSALLEMNPKLGISARIIEDYARSDGKFYPAAVQHVLGTLDPRIPALGDWEAVDFSSDDDADMIIDLSVSHFAGEPVPEPGAGDLSDEDLFDVLLDVLEPDELAVYAEHGDEASWSTWRTSTARSSPSQSRRPRTTGRALCSTPMTTLTTSPAPSSWPPRRPRSARPRMRLRQRATMRTACRPRWPVFRQAPICPPRRRRPSVSPATTRAARAVTAVAAGPSPGTARPLPRTTWRAVTAR
jgi:hypothetical protein